MAKRNWPAIHKSWQKSGETVTSFCRENSIAVSGFYGGLKKHGLSTAGGSMRLYPRRKFVKAVIPRREISPIVVELPNGLLIRLPELNESVLVTLLSVKGT